MRTAGADLSLVQARDGAQGGQVTSNTRCRKCRLADEQCSQCAAVDRRARELNGCTDDDTAASLKRYLDALEGPESD
jgi:hypothetical protein